MSLVENYGPMLPEAELEEGPEFEMELEDIMVEGLSPDDMAFMASMQEEVAVEIEIPHFANLAEYLGDDELSDIAERVIEGFEADRDSRSEWDETLTRGLDLLGLKFEETGTAFDGSCAATHPLIIESAVKFQSKASQEILPADGPVRTQIIRVL